MNPEGAETQPTKPFESALLECKKAVYGPEYKPDTINRNLLNVLMTGRLDNEISPTDLDKNLAELATHASLVARQNNDNQTEAFYSQFAESFKIEKPSSKTSPISQQPTSSPRGPKERITIRGPAHIIIKRGKGQG